jgi:hypothetical protein
MIASKRPSRTKCRCEHPGKGSITLDNHHAFGDPTLKQQTSSADKRKYREERHPIGGRTLARAPVGSLLTFTSNKDQYE